MSEPWKISLIIHQSNGLLVVESAEQALRVLDEIPSSERGYLYGMAKRRCEANLRGEASEGAAQLALRAAISEVGNLWVKGNGPA